MLPVILIFILTAILTVLVVISYYLPSDHAIQSNEKLGGQFGQTKNYVYTSIILISVAMVAAVYIWLKDTIWAGHVMEWLNIVIRLMHITFGIAWIGASFYFVFLENALNRTEGVRDELAGNLWAVHGGGFYYLEKYKEAPKSIPKHLHWFKYEAYFTWVSGFALLFIIYYFNAAALLIDPTVLQLTEGAAIAIGVGSFIVAWVMYDLLCKSSLSKKPYLFSIIGVLLLIGFAWFYAQVFSGRAAFIHFGAMLGSLMAGNVFFVIIPAQKAMVNAAKQGQMPDAQKGKNALFRSISNNYFTLPVLFVMVSNHFPGTFGNKYQWLVLAIISLAAAGIKHWLNLREQGKLSVWILPASVLLLLSAAYVTAPKISNKKCEEVSFATANAIVQQRCVSCHSSKPTDAVYTTAPNGVKYDTPLEIIAKKDLIMQRVVLTKTMPQNNKTNMTPEEREFIRCWIENGAKIQ